MGFITQHLCNEACQHTEYNEYRKKQVRTKFQQKDHLRRDHVGALLKDALGYDLAKDPDQWRHQQHGKPAAALSEQLYHERCCHGRVGHHRNIRANKGGGEQPFGLVEHIQGKLCPPRSLGCIMAKLYAVGTDHPDFGTGEEAGVAAGHYMQRGKLFYLVKK